MSPRAHKKRRMGSGPDALVGPKEEDDGSPEHQIEEELATSLNPANPDNQDSLNGDHGSTEAADPEVAAALGNIINRSERLEEQFAFDQAPTDDSRSSVPKGVSFIKASLSLKIQSLPILDNLVRVMRVLSLVLCLRLNLCSLPKYSPFSPNLLTKTSRRMCRNMTQRMVKRMQPCARYFNTQGKCILPRSHFYRRPNLI